MVIAIFYASEISWLSLGTGLGFLAIWVGANLVGIRSPLVYGLVGVEGVWLAFLFSGIHPTIAGVLTALSIPTSSTIINSKFSIKSQLFGKAIQQANVPGVSVLENKGQTQAVHAIETASSLIQPPLQKLEQALYPWVTSGIMPIFALANGGITITAEAPALFSHPLRLGIDLGLLPGKPLGICLGSWAVVKSGYSALPPHLQWRQIFGL